MSQCGNIWVYDLQRAANRNIDLGWENVSPVVKVTKSGGLLIDAGPFDIEAPAGNWIRLSAAPHIAYGIKLNSRTPGTCFEFVIAIHKGKYYLASAFNFDQGVTNYTLCKIARIPRGESYLIDGRDPNHLFSVEVHDIMHQIINFDFGETFNR